MTDLGYSPRQRGFTMIELVITVTLVAILAGLAAPSMRTYVLNSRITGTAQDILRSLQTARSEAVKRQSSVVACASANPEGAFPICAVSSATPNGWIVFQDTDNSWQRNVGEPLVSTGTYDNTRLWVLADQQRRVSYAASGFANTVGGTNSTAIVVCDSRGNVDSGGRTAQATSVARGISIAATGRARITNVRDSSTDNQDISDMLGSTRINSSCPPAS